MRKSLLTLGLALPLLFGSVPVKGVLAASRSQAPATSGQAVVDTALRYLGYPYTTVGNSPSEGFSCIGFVSYVYQSLGIPLPDDLWDGMAYAPQISFSDLQPGDVLWFQNTVWPGLSHTAIYLGGGRFVHAEWYNRGVVTSSFSGDPIDGDYWTSHFLGATRPWAGASLNPTVPTTSAQAQPTSQLRTGPHALVRLGVNLRMRPSLRAPVRDVISAGTSVVVLKQYWNWFWVQLPDSTYGWVIGPAIGKGVTSGVATTAFSGNARASVDGLRIHTRPGLNAPIVTAAYHGERLRVLYAWSGWLRVMMRDGTKGWVSQALVYHRGAVPAAAPAATPRRIAAHGRLAQAPMNVRSGPSLRRAIVAELVPGMQYRVLGWSNGWAHVQLAGGDRGFVYGGLLGGAHAASVSRISATSGPRLTAGVRVHAHAGIRAPVLGLAAAGTHIRVLGSLGSWTHVRLPGGRTGYISSAYINQ